MQNLPIRQMLSEQFSTPVVTTCYVKKSKTVPRASRSRRHMVTERLDRPVLSAASDTPQSGPAETSGCRLLRMHGASWCARCRRRRPAHPRRLDALDVTSFFPGGPRTENCTTVWFPLRLLHTIDSPSWTEGTAVRTKLSRQRDKDDRRTAGGTTVSRGGIGGLSFFTFLSLVRLSFGCPGGWCGGLGRCHPARSCLLHVPGG